MGGKEKEADMVENGQGRKKGAAIISEVRLQKIAHNNVMERSWVRIIIRMTNSANFFPSTLKPLRSIMTFQIQRWN